MTELTDADAAIRKMAAANPQEHEDMRSYEIGKKPNADPENPDEMQFGEPDSAARRRRRARQQTAPEAASSEPEPEKAPSLASTPEKWEKDAFELVNFFMNNGLSSTNIFVSSNLPDSVQWYFPTKNIVMLSKKLYTQLGIAYLKAAENFWSKESDGFVVEDQRLWQDAAISPYLAMMGASDS